MAIAVGGAFTPFVAFAALFALIGGGNLLYGKHSHGAAATARRRPAQEEQNRAIDEAQARAREEREQARAEREQARRRHGRRHLREPVPRYRRGAPHLSPRRSGSHHRAHDRRARQGAGGGQGGAPHLEQVRGPAGAADPRGPLAVAGPQRPRHRQPGRGDRDVPARARGPVTCGQGPGPPGGDRPDRAGAPPGPAPLRHAGGRVACPVGQRRRSDAGGSVVLPQGARARRGRRRCSMRAPRAGSPTATSSWSPSIWSKGARCAAAAGGAAR